jgi:hypothetical protein
VDFEGCFDLYGRQLLAKSISSVNFVIVSVHGLLLCTKNGGTHFASQLGIFVNFLLCVPEPLVNLVFFETQFIGELGDLLSGGGLSLKIFVKLPKGVLLALRFAGSYRSIL